MIVDPLNTNIAETSGPAPACSAADIECAIDVPGSQCPACGTPGDGVPAATATLRVAWKARISLIGATVLSVGVVLNVLPGPAVC